jgi:Tol biopolymer transport system component
VIDAETGETREIARGYYAEWSPDGQSIAFSNGLGLRENAVFTVSATGGEPRMIANGTDPAWSPDGTTILVTSEVP